MNVHVDPYVDEAEFAEFMAELRLWRKEVRWCVQSLLAEGLHYTIELTAPTLGAAFRREAFGLYAVEETNNSIHGRSRHQIEKGDFLVAMNRLDLAMEDLTLAEVTSRVQSLPRPSHLKFVRLRKKASSEAQTRLRLIQRQVDALENQRHALRNRAKGYDVTVREDKVIKTHLERQGEILAFVKKKVLWMKKGINLSREYRLMDKMKMWMTLQLQKPVPVPSISVVREPVASAPAIVPPSPRSSGKAKILSLSSNMSSQSSSIRNLSWIDDFPSVDLVWLGKEKEKNFNSLLKWFEGALNQDVPLSVAKVLAEQIVKALVRHWIDIRNANTSDDAQKLRRSFHDHARQLKSNLQANANLRADIVHEVITPEALMTMSKDELASPQIFQQRQELQQSAMRQVIVQPMEGNILIKTRDGFREVPVPVSAAGAATELPENVKKVLDTLHNAPPPPPNDLKAAAAPVPKLPPVAPTPHTARPPTREQPPSQYIPPKPADGYERHKDAIRMKHRDPKHTTKATSPFDPPARKVVSAPIAVPMARHAASAPAAPLKRHRSIDLAADQSSRKKDGSPLKRVRSTDDTLPTTGKTALPPPRPPPTTWKVNAPVVPPPAALAMDMSTSPDLTPSIEVQQTRGLISEIFTNRKTLVDNVTKLVQVGNILGQQLVAPDIIAKTETISIAGMGSVVRVHIGKFTVQSSAEKGASMGQVKENGVKAFVEAIENVRSVFTEVVEKFAANRRRGMDKVAAAQELVQSFPDVVVHDTQPRPKEIICSWMVGKVLVGRHSHKDEHVANVCGWRSFSDFLESMTPKVVRGAGDPLAKKQRTDHAPPTMTTARGALKQTSRASNTVVCFKCSTTHSSGMCPPRSPQSPVACYEAEIMPSKYSRQ